MNKIKHLFISVLLFAFILILSGCELPTSNPFDNFKSQLIELKVSDKVNKDFLVPAFLNKEEGIDLNWISLDKSILEVSDKVIENQVDYYKIIVHQTNTDAIGYLKASFDYEDGSSYFKKFPIIVEGTGEIIDENAGLKDKLNQIKIDSVLDSSIILPAYLDEKNLIKWSCSNNDLVKISNLQNDNGNKYYIASALNVVKDSNVTITAYVNINDTESIYKDFSITVKALNQSYNSIKEIKEGKIGTLYTTEGVICSISKNEILLKQNEDYILVYSQNIENIKIGYKVSIKGISQNLFNNVQIGSANSPAEIKILGSTDFSYPNANDLTNKEINYYLNELNFNPEYIIITGKLNVYSDHGIEYYEVKDFASGNVFSIHNPIDNKILNFLNRHEVKILGYVFGSIDKKYIQLSLTNIEDLGSEEILEFKNQVEQFNFDFSNILLEDVLPKYLNGNPNYLIKWSTNNKDYITIEEHNNDYSIKLTRPSTAMNVTVSAEFVFLNEKIVKTFDFTLLKQVAGEDNYKVETIDNLKAQAEDSVHVTFRIPFGAIIQGKIREFADDFEAIYPSVKITLDVVSGYDDMKKATIEDIQAGSAPTMTVGYPDHFAEYLISKSIISLEKFIKYPIIGYTEEELDDFIPGYIKENRQFDLSGSLVGLPFNKSTEVMYYNADLFNKYKLKVPTTWDEMNEVSAQIMEIVKDIPDGQYSWLGKIQTNLAASEFIPCIYDSGGNLTTTIIHQFGGEYTDSIFNQNGIVDFQSGSIKFNTSAKAKEGIKFLQDSANLGYFNMPDKINLTHGSGAISNGQNIMNIGSTGGSSYYNQAICNIGVAPIPYRDVKHKNVIQQGTNVCIFSQANDLEKLAAWLFIKHMLAPENTADFAVTTGYMPVRRSAYYLPIYTDFLESPKLAAKVHKATLKYVQEGWTYFVDAAWSGSSTVRKECETAMATILCDGVDIEQALNDAVNRIG